MNRNGVSDVDCPSGLPNLASLSRFFNVSTTIPDCDPAEFILCVPADPTRWSIEFTCYGGQSAIVSTIPDSPPSRGWEIPNNGSRLFQFKDQGTFVTQAWYIFGKGAINPAIVVDCCIRDLRVVQFLR